MRRSRPVVFIVTREVRVPKKVEQTRKILSDLIQWKVGKSYIPFWKITRRSILGSDGMTKSDCSLAL